MLHHLWQLILISGIFVLRYLLTISHKFSIELRSGLWGGHARRSIFWLESQLWIIAMLKNVIDGYTVKGKWFQYIFQNAFIFILVHYSFNSYNWTYTTSRKVITNHNIAATVFCSFHFVPGIKEDVLHIFSKLNLDSSLQRTLFQKRWLF